ncbi:MAG: isoprenylcysteine carboxylmethyltransferase family protein [Anaerolineae bacterium]
METVTDWVVSAGSAVLMIVVIGSWLVSVRSQKSARTISSHWFALPAWGQVMLGFTTIAMFIWLGSVLWIPLPLRLSEPGTTILRSIGLGIFLVGLFLPLWARWALGAVYGISTSSSAPLQEKHRLVQRGPYVFIRHPMYLGYWLVILGVLLTYRTWTPLALLAMTVPSFHRRARREEVSLEETFGAEWHAYAARVPMFLPR